MWTSGPYREREDREWREKYGPRGLGMRGKRNINRSGKKCRGKSPRYAYPVCFTRLPLHKSSSTGCHLWLEDPSCHTRNKDTRFFTVIIPESIAKGSSGKSFEHLHFDTHTYTHTHTLEERKHPSAKYASVKVCKCKYASMICKGEYASTQWLCKHAMSRQVWVWKTSTGDVLMKKHFPTL